MRAGIPGAGAAVGGCILRVYVCVRVGGWVDRHNIDTYSRPYTHQHHAYKQRRRVFPDSAYATAGAEVREDLAPASVLLGVKQPPLESLLPDRCVSFCDAWWGRVAT